MTAPGAHLTLMIGPIVAVPVPEPLTKAVEKIEITRSDFGRSGFQIVFRAARDAGVGLDMPLLALRMVKPGFRVVVMLTLGNKPRVLMDGIIESQELSPAEGEAGASVTVTGNDLSVVMDKNEDNVEHPAQPDPIIAAKIIASYAVYGMIPIVVPPLMIDVPIPIDRVPMQQESDLKYLQKMAERHAYIFMVIPGPAPLTNIGYWGPPVRIGAPQSALSIDLGADTNVSGVSFEYDTAAARRLEGRVQDRTTNKTFPVRSLPSLRPPLALQGLLAQSGLGRKMIYVAEGARSVTQAMSDAQAQADASSDVLAVSGELDVGRYGDVLSPRGLVGLRGAGLLHDGLYYVQQVTDKIERGKVTQAFKLVREGLGSTVPLVPV